MISGRQWQVDVQGCRIVNRVQALIVDIDADGGDLRTAAAGCSSKVNRGSARCTCSRRRHGD